MVRVCPPDTTFHVLRRRDDSVCPRPTGRRSSHPTPHPRVPRTRPLSVGGRSCLTNPERPSYSLLAVLWFFRGKSTEYTLTHYFEWETEPRNTLIVETYPHESHLGFGRGRPKLSIKRVCPTEVGPPTDLSGSGVCSPFPVPADGERVVHGRREGCIFPVRV